MPVGFLCSFSSNRENFAVFSAGGVVNIWDCCSGPSSRVTSTTVLPNHLQAVCTCLAWCPTTCTQQNNTSTKHDNGRCELLAYGSSNGSIFMFNSLTSSITASLANGHTGALTAVTWHPNGRTLFSAADDGFIIEWNTKENKIFRRWRCPQTDGRGNCGYSALAVLPNEDHRLFAARQQIDVWDLEAGRVTHSFVGHSTDIIALLPVTCTDSETNDKNGYVISLAKNDRVMYAWRSDMLPSKINKNGAVQFSPTAAFLLPDSAVTARASFHPESHCVQIFVVLSNGCIAAYKHILNGKKIKEPIRHTALVEVLSPSGKSTETQVTNASRNRLPVIDICTSGNDAVTIVYGDVAQPMFDILDMKTRWNEAHVKLLRESFVNKVKSMGADGVNGGFENYRYHVASVLPTSIKSGKKRTLGDALKQSTSDVLQQSAASTVLAQGLLSRDKRILDSILGVTPPNQSKRAAEYQKEIEAAVTSLDENLLLTLLDELTTRLASGHPAASKMAGRWLAALLRIRGPRLASACATSSTRASSNVVSNRLVHLRDVLIARTVDSSRVLQLRGRLKMLRDLASSKPPSVGSSVQGLGNGIPSSNVNTSTATGPQLPFVLNAADLSSSDDESEDSGSAMDTNDLKMKQKSRLNKNRREESSASEDGEAEEDEESDVDLAADEVLVNGDRDSHFSDLDDLSEKEEDDDESDVDDRSEGNSKAKLRKHSKEKVNGFNSVEFDAENISFKNNNKSKNNKKHSSYA